MNDSKNDILLYWTGEADSKTSQRVLKLIEQDTEARTYLSELQELETGLKSDQKGRVAGIPLRRDGLLDEVLKENNAQERPGKHLPTQNSWSDYAPLMKAAAVFALLAVAVFLLLRPDNPSQNIAESAPSKTPESAVEDRPANQMTLSKRLLTKSDSFRRSGNGLEALRDNRERREKLRTNKFKS